MTGYIHCLDRSKPGWLAKWRDWIPLNVRSKRVSGGAPARPGLRHKICMIHSQFCSILCLYFICEANLGPVDSRRDPARSKLFPPVKPHAPDTVNRPPLGSLSFIDRQKQRLWDLGHRLRDPELKYVIKTGAGTAILALPAFLAPTRELFVRYRGEWALISFVVGENNDR